MDFKELETSLSELNNAFEENTAKAINKNVTARNWLIGFYIVNYEQHGEDRAAYGEKTLQTLSERLNQKSLSYRNLRLYRQFYLEYSVLEKPIYEYAISEFGTKRQLVTNIRQNLIEDKNNKDLAITDCQIVQSPTAQFTAPDLQIPPEKLFTHLSFTHFTLIMSVENPLARVFYELETIKGTWTVRELKRQIHTNYFERSAISQNSEKMSQYVQGKSEKTDLKELIKSPYIYEFLGLKDKDIVEEADLEEALINHLEEFMLELGNGFCFESRQKRILVDDDYFFCDLVFYHRILKCHVLIDLKAAKIKYDDISQMNLYLSYYRHNIMQKDDNPPVGILMCTEAGKELVKYATEGIDENLFVQKYKLNLPDEKQLTEWLKKEIGAKLAKGNS